MKLKLKPKLLMPKEKQNLKLLERDGVKRRPFDALVEEAVEVTKKLDVLNSADGARLSAEALIRETAANAGSTPERIAKLRGTIDRSIPRLGNIESTLNRMSMRLRQRNWGASLKDEARIRGTSSDATHGELARLGANLMELWCVAAARLSDSQPELFGACDNTEKHAEQVAALTVKQKELLERIGSEFTGTDTVENAANQTAFALGGGAIAVHPRSDAGARLVRFLVNNPNKLR